MIALTITSISGCEKTNTNDYKKFLGTWISKDSVDTIEFTSDQDIYKMISGFNDHFLYSLQSTVLQLNTGGKKFLTFIWDHQHQPFIS
jgi:hypothetical protein